jgi:hypothetical protein
MNDDGTRKGIGRSLKNSAPFSQGFLTMFSRISYELKQPTQGEWQATNNDELHLYDVLKKLIFSHYSPFFHECNPDYGGY